MGELLAHLWGDYIVQSDWMAINKVNRSWPALVHAAAYMAGFGLLAHSWGALAIIGGTHFLIDRFRLAKYICFAKNFYCCPIEEFPKWSECKATGYPADRPVWLTTWLMIIADNTLHLLINHLALR